MDLLVLLIVKLSLLTLEEICDMWNMLLDS